jgi:hypothetical protein
VEGGDLLTPEFRGVAKAMEMDESLDPAGVSLFGTAAVVAQLHEPSSSLE